MDNSFSLPILHTLRASALIDERFTGALSALHGVSLREVTLMLYVRNSPGSKLSRIELAKRLCVSPSTVTRAAKPLEKIGLIDRKSNSRDARLSYVVLTASGNKLLGHAEKTLEQLSKDFLSRHLSKEDRSQFSKILSSLITEFPGDCL
ncbi:MAG: MarR family transcriptional regulator [Oceanicoccus sp.]